MIERPLEIDGYVFERPLEIESVPERVETGLSGTATKFDLRSWPVLDRGRPREK
ncbi:hypothetical protein ACLI4Y_08555 [Natrialbaceae archaeon A-CW3]